MKSFMWFSLIIVLLINISDVSAQTVEPSSGPPGTSFLVAFPPDSFSCTYYGQFRGGPVVTFIAPDGEDGEVTTGNCDVNGENRSFTFTLDIPEPIPLTDSDGDGILDGSDACPAQGDVNGTGVDATGCPNPPPVVSVIPDVPVSPTSPPVNTTNEPPPPPTNLLPPTSTPMPTLTPTPNVLVPVTTGECQTIGVADSWTFNIYDAPGGNYVRPRDRDKPTRVLDVSSDGAWYKIYDRREEDSSLLDLWVSASEIQLSGDCSEFIIPVSTATLDTPGIIEQIEQSCPELMEQFDAIPSELQAAYEINACASLAQTASQNVFPPDAELAGVIQTNADIVTDILLENECVLLVGSFVTFVEGIAQIDEQAMIGMVEALWDSDTPCEDAKHILGYGYHQHPDPDNISDEKILTCIPGVVDKKIEQIQDFVRDLDSDTADFNESPCQTIKGIGALVELKPEEREIYDRFIDCGYTDNAALGFVLHAARNNIDLTIIPQTSNCGEISQHLLDKKNYREYTPLPEQIATCESDTINLFMRMLTLPTENGEPYLTESEIERLLNAGNPCTAIALYLRTGKLPDIVLPQPSLPADGSGSTDTGTSLIPVPASSLSIATPINIPVDAPYQPSELEIALGEVEPGKSIPSEIPFIRSNLFIDGTVYFVGIAEDGDSTDIYMGTDDEVTACLTGSADAFQPAFYDLQMAFYEVDDAGTIRLIITGECDEDNPLTRTIWEAPDGLRYDIESRITWIPGKINNSLLVTLIDANNRPVIYEFNERTGNKPVIPDAKNADYVAGLFVVYETGDGQLQYERLQTVLDPSNSDEGRAVTIQPDGLPCSSPVGTTLKIEGVPIAFVCDTSIYIGLLLDGSDIISYMTSHTPFNLDVITNTSLYTYDDGNRIYSYKNGESSEILFDTNFIKVIQLSWK